MGGGLGFAMAPALTTVAYVSWGTSGLLGLLVPAGIVATLLAYSFSHSAAPTQLHGSAGPTWADSDDWRAFGILSGATICRSIVFYGLNTFLALYFIDRWNLTAGEGNKALVVFLGTSIVGTLLGGWLADRVGRRAVIRSGFAGAVVFLALFLLVTNRTWALVVLVPAGGFYLHADERACRAGTRIPAATRWCGLGSDAGSGRQCRGDVRTAARPARGSARAWSFVLAVLLAILIFASLPGISLAACSKLAKGSSINPL